MKDNSSFDRLTGILTMSKPTKVCSAWNLWYIFLHEIGEYQSNEAKRLNNPFYVLGVPHIKVDDEFGQHACNVFGELRKLKEAMNPDELIALKQRLRGMYIGKIIITGPPDKKSTIDLLISDYQYFFYF